jgi:predicted 2-oxoglutarate/Fe(II)-dependent dioxygenase YbiX
LKEAFNLIIEMEKNLDEIEKKMAENPDNLEIIETYTSLLEQFNNI